MTPVEIKEFHRLRRVKRLVGLDKARKARYRVLKRKFKHDLTAKQRRLEKLRESLHKTEAKMGVSEPPPRIAPKEKKERHVDMGIPIKDEVAVHLAERKAALKKRQAEVQSFGPDLLYLFNVQCVDFLKQQKDGTFKPVTWPKQATHKLMPTMWAEERDVQLQLLPDRESQTNKPGKLISTGYEGRAHAVALIPMKRPVPKAELEIVRPLSRWSKRWPPYKTEWEIRQKRIALLEYARLTGVYRKKGKSIMLLAHKECDALLKEFIKASRALRLKQSKDPKMKAFWAKRKAALAAEKEQKEKPQPPKPKTFLDHFNKNERKIISEALTASLKARQLR